MSSNEQVRHEQVRRFFDTSAVQYEKEINRWITKMRGVFLRSTVFGSTLEVGVGPALLAREYAPPGAFTGCDLSKEMICLARKNFPQGKYLVCDAEELPFEESSFDTVVASEVIYYLDDPRRFLKRVGQVLRPGGRAIILWGNPLLNSCFALMSKLGMRPNDPFGERTIKTKDLLGMVRESLPVNRIELFGVGIPMIGFSRNLVFFSPVLAMTIDLR